MIRVRSTDVWFDAPGIQAAYQPIAAPDAMAARQNMSNDARMAGRHTAMSGILPTHDPRTGWLHTGADLWLSTGITVDPANTTVIIGLDNSDMDRDRRCLGSSAGNFFLAAYFGLPRFVNGGAVNGSGSVRRCVLGMAGQSGYFNGVINATIPTGTPGSGTLYIGRAWFIERYKGNIKAVLICSRILSPAHIAQYSRQMAYCHVNPDWNAWSRRRRYYYAPSRVAGFQSAWAQRRNTLIGGGM